MSLPTSRDDVPALTPAPDSLSPSPACPVGANASAPGRLEFTSLYRSTVAPLRRYLASLLSDRTEAQDVAQDAFVKVHAVMEERTVEQPRAYLFTTARRLALNLLRHRRAAPFSPAAGDLVDRILSQSPNPAALAMNREELARLQREIAGLPPRCREVLVLYRMEQLNYDEIAQKLGTARSTVEKQLARAMFLLRERAAASATPAPGSAGQLS